MYLSLAIRNLLRNRRRTLISMASVVAGVAVIVVGRGFISGLSENIIRAQVDVSGGHITVRPADYPTLGLDHPVDRVFAPSDELRRVLDEQAQAWTERTFFAPQAIFKGDSVRVRAIGFDPRRDPAVFPRETWRVDGKVPESAEDGVLVSQGIAELLALSPGDRLVLQVKTHPGAVNALDMPVSGVVTVGSPLLDKFGVLLTEDLASELVQHGKQSTHVAARLRRRSTTDAAAAALATAAGPELEVVTWAEEVEGMMAIQRVRETALGILVLALMGISAAGIANTVLMAAYERVREVGTLRAMGMTHRAVMLLFVLEGAIMGVVGSAIGVASATAVVLYFQANGIDLTDAMKNAGSGNLPVSAMLYARFDPAIAVLAFVFGVVTSILASLYPSRVASSMPPAEAVRG